MSAPAGPSTRSRANRDAGVIGGEPGAGTIGRQAEAGAIDDDGGKPRLDSWRADSGAGFAAEEGTDSTRARGSCPSKPGRADLRTALNEKSTQRRLEVALTDDGPTCPASPAAAPWNAMNTIAVPPSVGGQFRSCYEQLRARDPCSPKTVHASLHYAVRANRKALLDFVESDAGDDAFRSCLARIVPRFCLAPTARKVTTVAYPLVFSLDE
jgi:hypothetical protein